MNTSGIRNTSTYSFHVAPQQVSQWGKVQVDPHRQSHILHQAAARQRCCGMSFWDGIWGGNWQVLVHPSSAQLCVNPMTSCTSLQAETHLVFPKSASVEQLKLIRDSVAAERDQRLCGGQPVQPIAQAVAPLASTSVSTPSPESSAAASSQPVTPPPSEPSSLVKMYSSLV